MSAILLLDKPIGLSSNIALQKVKRLFQAKKAGHAGTLDPLATGMLPIFFGEATKFTQYLLDADKTYAVTMELGVRTNTSDKEGEVVSAREVPALSENAIEKLFAQYRGAQQQIPSMFSALKYQGKPLYEYARAGLTVERAARAIHIFELNFISIENNFVHFIVKCSKGTYVRTLVDDMGEKLGCGAHVTALRRLSMAGFSEKEMYTLEQCEHFIRAHSHFLLPMDTVLLHLPAVTVDVDAATRLQQGCKVENPPQSPFEKGGLVRLYCNQHFLGVGEIIDGKLQPRRLLTCDYHAYSPK